MPYVSVIIPCYNLQDFIVDCIISVEEQTYKNFEIIVIDDGSKDESAKRIKEYIAKSGVSNIRLFCKKMEELLLHVMKELEGLRENMLVLLMEMIFVDAVI